VNDERRTFDPRDRHHPGCPYRWVGGDERVVFADTGWVLAAYLRRPGSFDVDEAMTLAELSDEVGLPCEVVVRNLIELGCAGRDRDRPRSLASRLGAVSAVAAALNAGSACDRSSPAPTAGSPTRACFRSRPGPS
jgi:hypothetical protein